MKKCAISSENKHQQNQVIKLNYLIKLKQKNYNTMITTSERNISEKVYFTIKKEYLQEFSYNSVKTNSQKLNQLYDELCNIFISNNEALRATQILHYQSKNQKAARRDIKDYLSIQFLQKFMTEFSNIVNQISSFQINSLNRSQHQNKPQFDVYYQFSKQLKELNFVYDDIDNNKTKLDPIFKEIKFDFITYKKNIDNPLYFYDQIYVEKTNERLLGNIQKANTHINAILQRKQHIQTKISEFQPLFSKFKCKLVKNKYNILNKLNHFAQNTKYCLAQTTQLLRQCVINTKKQYQHAIKSSMEDSNQLKELLNKSSIQISIENPLDQNRKWQNVIRQTMHSYWKQNQVIQILLQRLHQYFTEIFKSYQEKKFKFREIINKICQFYEDKQSPLDELITVFNLNESLQEKFQMISIKLRQILKVIQESKKNCTMHGEIILSLLKIKNAKKQGLLQYPESKNIKQVSDLINQIGICSPKQSIIQFFQFWIATQNQLLHSIKLTTKSSIKTKDSMEISHTLGQNKFNVERKKPLREQIWLWKDIKEEMDINLELYRQYFVDIQKFTSQMGQKFINKNNLQLQKYECVLLNLKKSANLILLSQSLAITANEFNISIKWKDILNIEQVANFFDIIITITTPLGKIELAKFKGNVEIILASIKETQQKSLMGNQTKIETKKEIILTPEEIKQIMERKEKIMKDVPKTDGFKLIIEQALENERIDVVYDLIYSDKPFTFYGREEPCFFSYTGKKSGNFNWIAEKYDQVGPEFYTLQEGVNFKNCPIFSTRKISFNHPMKPIPFMPKQSKNLDERRIYWISHEEFVYYIKSFTSQVPMADNFVVHLIHQVTKIETGVKISIYSKIEFVKQTSFKNIIIKNTDPQIDENMISFMGQIKRLFKLRKEAASGAKIAIELQPTIQNKAALSSDSQVNKLKLYNKILVIGLLLLLLFNLIYVF